MWRNRGQERPPFADQPRPGQESAWDYPRPPVALRDWRLVEVFLDGVRVARSSMACRVLETASPPTFYLPPADVNLDLLVRAGGESFCEWKGTASYFDIHGGKRTVARGAWCYEAPRERFAHLAGWLAFYPQQLDCRVAGEPVRAQDGGFYGGWITSEVAGPFKGEPGTGGW